MLASVFEKREEGLTILVLLGLLLGLLLLLLLLLLPKLGMLDSEWHGVMRVQIRV